MVGVCAVLAFHIVSLIVNELADSCVWKLYWKCKLREHK